jgi:hypothetical protein
MTTSKTVLANFGTPAVHKGGNKVSTKGMGHVEPHANFPNQN